MDQLRDAIPYQPPAVQGDPGARDTIFALATAQGRAGVAVVRISGPSALSALRRLNEEAAERSLKRPRELLLTKLRAPATGELIDEALVVCFQHGASFTGEPVVELHLHGGRAIVAAMDAALAAMPGVRHAAPGEFTRRALENGRLDLTQVEALGDLIDADTQAQRLQALGNLEGQLSAQARTWRAALLDLRADLEARLDFADEGDVIDAIPPDFSARLTALADAMAGALRDANRGEIIRSGFRVVIAGPPNAGKSSLLNALAGRDAAIVADMPGTTRDTVAVELDLAGRKIIVTDTAGLRDTADAVEQAGIDRTTRALDEAHAVIWMRPAAQTATASPMATGNAVPTIAIASRADEAPDYQSPAAQRLSVVTGEGVAALTDWIARTASDATESVHACGVTNARQRLEIEACHASVAAADERVSGAHPAPELIAEDLRLASDALGRLVGAIGTEELLGKIFSSFCIGK